MFGVLQILSNTSRANKVWKRENVRHQTMFARVWSPNISRLDRAYASVCLVFDANVYWIQSGGGFGKVSLLPAWIVSFLQLFSDYVL